MKRFLLVLALASLPGLTYAQTHPLSAEETLALWNPGAIVAAPASPTVLYSVSHADLAENRTLSEWRQLGANGAVRGLPPDASGLTWSPDGSRLAYLADDAVWVFDWGVRRGARLCDARSSNSYLAHEGNRLAWSPDGQWIAFAATLEPDPPTQDPVVVTRVQYKTRTSLSDNRRTHIYVVSATGGTPKLLTPGDHDEHSLDWSAGPEIVFLSNHEPDADARLNYDIFAVDPRSGAIRQITRTPGVEMTPRLSPDGKQIAYLATRRPLTTIDSIAEDEHVWVIPASGGAAREVNPQLDGRCSGVTWTHDSELVYQVQDHGSVLLYRGQQRLFDGDAQSGAVVEHAGRLYFLHGDALHPREVWSLGEGAPRPETHLNDALTASWTLSKPEKIEFRSFDGTPVEGWLYPPVNGAARWPLILSVHGGPHGMLGYAFNPAVQYDASRGYASLLVNPRGSSGYGQKFSDGCVNNWGGGDYKDLMAAVDYALKSHALIDPANLFVTGGSYGGFMTNWIVTQTTRFRAAMAAASVSDLISFYATSLYQDLIHAEFGEPWEGNNYVTLWNWSPLKYVKNVQTPLMLLHGEQDNDVHITQAEQMYTALRQRGVEAVLVRYPREGHGFREPRHQLDFMERRLDWFDKHRH